MPVSGKRGGKLYGSRIDDRPEILWRSPRVLRAGPPGDPEVVGTETSGPIGCEVEAQAILGDGSVLIVKCSIDKRTDVDRLAPIRITRAGSEAQAGCHAHEDYRNLCFHSFGLVVQVLALFHLGFSNVEHIRGCRLWSSPSSDRSPRRPGCNRTGSATTPPLCLPAPGRPAPCLRSRR